MKYRVQQYTEHCILKKSGAKDSRTNITDFNVLCSQLQIQVKTCMLLVQLGVLCNSELIAPTSFAQVVVTRVPAYKSTVLNKSFFILQKLKSLLTKAQSFFPLKSHYNDQATISRRLTKSLSKNPSRNVVLMTKKDQTLGKNLILNVSKAIFMIMYGLWVRARKNGPRMGNKRLSIRVPSFEKEEKLAKNTQKGRFYYYSMNVFRKQLS